MVTDGKTLLANVVGVIEANSYEVMKMWQGNKKVFSRGGSGILATVGQLDNRPVCISLTLYPVDTGDVLCWHPTSEVVDHKMITEWFAENLPTINGERVPSADAMNSHHVFHTL